MCGDYEPRSNDNGLKIGDTVKVLVDQDPDLLQHSLVGKKGRVIAQEMGQLLVDFGAQITPWTFSTGGTDIKDGYGWWFTNPDEQLKKIAKRIKAEVK
jgi:hypothetical protein